MWRAAYKSPAAWLYVASGVDLDRLDGRIGELAQAHVLRDWLDRSIDRLLVVERVANGRGVREQLVVHPQIGDDARVLLGDRDRDLGVAEEIGETRDRELLIGGLRGDVDVGGQRFLEPIARAERDQEEGCRAESDPRTRTHVKEDSCKEIETNENDSGERAKR